MKKLAVFSLVISFLSGTSLVAAGQIAEICNLIAFEATKTQVMGELSRNRTPFKTVSLKKIRLLSAKRRKHEGRHIRHLLRSVSDEVVYGGENTKGGRFFVFEFGFKNGKVVHKLCQYSLTR